MEDHLFHLVEVDMERSFRSQWKFVEHWHQKWPTHHFCYKSSSKPEAVSVCWEIWTTMHTPFLVTTSRSRCIQCGTMLTSRISSWYCWCVAAWVFLTKSTSLVYSSDVFSSTCHHKQSATLSNIIGHYSQQLPSARLLSNPNALVATSNGMWAVKLCANKLFQFLMGSAG